MTLLDAFDNLAAGDSLILLKSAHVHPDYGLLLRDVLGEVGDLLGTDIEMRYASNICTILIASPRRVTPYHMDNAYNFLMQVHGTKTFYVFDGTDPEILSPFELEQFWSGDGSAACYSEAKQKKAQEFALSAGSGVHVPIAYPHWAQNGSEVSVAVSINFKPVRNMAADMFRLNAKLRRLGLNPTPPGRSKVLDASKLVGLRTITSVKQAVKRALH